MFAGCCLLLLLHVVVVDVVNGAVVVAVGVGIGAAAAVAAARCCGVLDVVIVVVAAAAFVQDLLGSLSHDAGNTWCHPANSRWWRTIPRALLSKTGAFSVSLLACLGFECVAS